MQRSRKRKLDKLKAQGKTEVRLKADYREDNPKVARDKRIQAKRFKSLIQQDKVKVGTIVETKPEPKPDWLPKGID